MRMPEIAGELPVVLRDVRRRVAGRARGHRERQQLIVRLKVLFADAPDVFGMFARAVRPPLAADRDAVRVDGADAGVGEPGDRGVGVLRRVVDVRPVEQRGDAGVERLERAHQVRDVDVLGAVLHADVVEHAGEVLVERAAREDAAHRRLPGVPVRVDEARHDDHPGGVDLFRIRRVEAAPDFDDLAVLHPDIAVGNLADVGIHRDDEAVADQKPLRAHASSIIVVPPQVGRFVSAPTRTDGVAPAAAGRDYVRFVTTAVVAARFLPIWLATGVLVLVAAIIAPEALQHTSWAFVLPYMTILAVAALGQMLVVMHAGIDLSTPGVMFLGGNLIVGIGAGSNGRLALAILACVGVGALVGFVNGIFVGVLRLNPLIVTLAVGQIVLAWGLKYSRDVASGENVPGALSSWAAEKPLGISSVFWTGAAITVAIALVLRYTAAGRRFQAVGANPRPPGWPVCTFGHTSCSRTPPLARSMPARRSSWQVCESASTRASAPPTCLRRLRQWSSPVPRLRAVWRVPHRHWWPHSR